MAGIGFELKRLFKEKGVIAILKAYGYTGAVTTGPMILGVLFLLSISYMGQFFGLVPADRDLMVSMITYALLASLIYSGLFSMVMTRYVADMLYQERNGDILPSLEGLCIIMLPSGSIFFGIFLGFSGISFNLMVIEYILFVELLLVWTLMNYLTAIKDYKGIFVSYLLAALLAIGLSYLLCRFVGVSIEVLLLSACSGYGIMICMDMVLLFRYFKSSGSHHFAFLSWFDEYKDLMIISVALDIGLFSHLVIAWFSKVGGQVGGLFYSAPKHDIAAMFAFLTILITSINFVASVEVHFYPKYRKYYDLFNGTGSITEIRQAEEEMMTVLDHELAYTARRQFYMTAISLSLGLVVLTKLPLGFDALMEGYFRILCVGYGVYAIGNVMMLILLYFIDYDGARRASLIFAFSTTGACLLSLFIDVKYYGFGFALGSLCYCFYCWLRLRKYMSKLSYHILSTQPLMKENRQGFWGRLGESLMKRKGVS